MEACWKNNQQKTSPEKGLRSKRWAFRSLLEKKKRNSKWKIVCLLLWAEWEHTLMFCLHCGRMEDERHMCGYTGLSTAESNDWFHMPLAVNNTYPLGGKVRSHSTIVKKGHPHADHSPKGSNYKIGFQGQWRCLNMWNNGSCTERFDLPVK